MRCLRAYVALAFVASFGLGRADDAKAEELTEEEDDDLDLEHDEEPFVEDREPVEEFDKDMAAEDQNGRMKSCFDSGVGRLQANIENVKETVQQIISQQPNMDKDRALNTILFSWVMACYMNIEDTELKALQNGGSLSEEQQSAVFSPEQRPGRTQFLRQATQRQWGLLETQVKKHQDEMSKQQKQRQSSSQSGSQSYQSGPGQQPQQQQKQEASSFGLGYVLLALAGVFGIIGLAVTKLLKNEDGGSSRREKYSSKSQRKAEQAEKKQNKKMR
jgi:hypothetical protein